MHCCCLDVIAHLEGTIGMPNCILHVLLTWQVLILPGMAGDMVLACYCHHGWHGRGLSWRTWHAMAMLVLLSLGHVRWWSMCRPKCHLTHSGHSWCKVVVAKSDNGDGDNGGGRRRVVIFVFGYRLDSSNQHGHMVLEFQWTWTDCLKLFMWLGLAAMDAWFNHICKAQ